MSTVILDTITGKSTATTITIGSTPVVSASANSMTIRGEGTAQTSIQQGLAKCWVNLSQVSTQSISDSFNVASISDGGTGYTTITYSSAMANSSYSRSTHMHRENTTANYANIDGSYNNDVFNTAALVVRTIFMNNAASGAVDSPIVSNQIFGDLA